MRGADDLFPVCVPPQHPHLPGLRRTLELLRAAQVPVPANVVPIGIRTEPNDRGLQGLFDPNALWAGARVMDRARRPALTALHEVGHALDFLVLGEGVEYASNLGGPARPWAAWDAAVNITPTIAALRTARNSAAETAEYATYLLELPEIFARAFAQWVIDGHGTPDERAALDDRDRSINGVLTQQWPEPEFATLVPHLRALLGLKRSSP